MKKLFIGALALTMFTACSQDEIVEQQQLSSAITFDGAFVNNATRAVDPSTTTSSIQNFDVWGFMDNTTGYVFNQQRVTKNGETWTYSPLQYWLPGHTYYFGALAPVENKNWQLDTNGANTYGIGKVSFKNVNGTEDLIYAATTKDTKSMEVGDLNVGSVELTFNHLLSKVKFSFTNGFDAPNYTITVSDIKMTVPSEGTIDLAVENWWDNDDWKLGTAEPATLHFGNMGTPKLEVTQRAESQYERLTIPANDNQSYVVTFDVELYSGEVLAYSNTLSTTITGAALNMGMAYDFHATLDETNIAGTALAPIQFTVTAVKDWVIDNGYEGGVIPTKVIGVKSAAELQEAIAVGETNFKLLTNINEVLTFGNSTLGRSVDNKEYVLDLNGKTIVNNSTSGEYGESEAIVTYSNLTINGTGTVKSNTRAVWARGADRNIVVTINGGTYEGAAEGFAKGGCSVIYASGGNVINIYGGEFKALAADKSSYADKTNGVYAALNVYDNDGMINVYGGKFYKQNPAMPGTEPAAWNKAHANGFVAEGYMSQIDGDYYSVVPALENITVTTADELFQAVNKGGNITLDADITIPSTVVVETGKTVVLNLNGKTLTNKLDNSKTDVIIVKGNLTINGEGTVEAVTGNDGYAVISEGVLTINGGTFKSGVDAENKPNAVIYARGNGKVYVNGGLFPNDNTSKFVLNKKDADRATTVIECTGGQFWNFNPSNNAAETAGTNFCATGYKAQKQGDGSWKVVPNEKK